MDSLIFWLSNLVKFTAVIEIIMFLDSYYTPYIFVSLKFQTALVQNIVLY
jgi:hypothetical protein